MMSSCTSFIIALGLMICFVWWMVVSDFLLLDLLFLLALIAILVISVLVIIAVVIWVIKELFN
jgi:hypothetical protein